MHITKPERNLAVWNVGFWLLKPLKVEQARKVEQKSILAKKL